MPQGLQVWDGSGNIVLDTNLTVVKEAIYTATSITSATTVSVPTIESNTIATVFYTTNTDEPTVSIDYSGKNLVVTGTGTYNIDIRLVNIP